MRRSASYSDTQRPFLKRMAGPFTVVFIMFYLCFHAISGERGLLALFTETRRLDEIKAELAEVKAQHDLMEHKVRLLSDQSLDLDMLDERVRAVLGMTGKNEMVYFLNDKPTGQE